MSEQIDLTSVKARSSDALGWLLRDQREQAGDDWLPLSVREHFRDVDGIVDELAARRLDAAHPDHRCGYADKVIRLTGWLLEHHPDLAPIPDAVDAAIRLIEALDRDYATMTDVAETNRRHVTEQTRYAQQVERQRDEAQARCGALYDEKRDQVAALQWELDRQTEWQNDLTRHIPEVYEASEGSQESVISQWAADAAKVLDIARRWYRGDPTALAALAEAVAALPDTDDEVPAGAAHVLAEIAAERGRQTAKHGDQSHLPDGTGPTLILRDLPTQLDRWAWADQLADWARARCQAASENEGGDGTVTFEHILTEEWAEAIAEADPQRLYVELIQIGAVAAQWAEAHRRRAKAVTGG